MLKRSFIVLTSVVLCGVLFAGCAKKTEPRPRETAPSRPPQGQAAPAADEAPSDGVSQKILAFNLEGFSERGQKQWEIQGESAEILEKDRVRLEHIVAKTYGSEAEAVLTADKGIYDRSRNNVHLEENVKVTINNSGDMSEEYADFSFGGVLGEEKKPAGEAGPGQEGAQADVTIVTCDGDVEFNYEKNTAFFSENVKVVSKDGSIEADLITLFLDLKSKKVREVVAEGNVRIHRGENITYSDKATYVEAEKRVILSGRPKLVLYQEGDGIGNRFLGQ